MGPRKLTFLMLACCSATMVRPAGAQTDLVKVKFEVDGDEVRQKFKVLLYLDDKVIEPAVSEGGFIAPPEVRSDERVNVRFLSGGYELFFNSVHAAAFGTDWVVGVDNKPFDRENTASEEPDPAGKELSRIYYITFASKKGLDTRTVVKVYRPKDSPRGGRFNLTNSPAPVGEARKAGGASCHRAAGRRPGKVTSVRPDAVAGARNRTVYGYISSGVRAIFPLKQLLSIVRR
ncbi:MAG TPA: hypothetical protein VF668_20100 [Pyrinomonadaceae bacterium]|jgi:hypothetical protein